MKLTIVDGVPGIGVTRGLKYAKTSGRSDAIILPSFADIHMANPSLAPGNMSESLLKNIHSLIGAIEEAEKKDKNLIIGGSPASLYAYSQVCGKTIDGDTLRRYLDIMQEVGKKSQIILIRSHPSYYRDMRRLKVLTGEQVEKLDQELLGAYQEISPPENFRESLRTLDGSIELN
ncbi:hypothetical protein H7170_03935 [Candidatus Gracilibacteria bacterium]|nr:hypothetical protein [Candidatus Gracilibacteria bacterium]